MEESTVSVTCGTSINSARLYVLGRSSLHSGVVKIANLPDW